MRGVLRAFIGGSCGLALAMIAGTASAQTSTLTDWQNSSGIVMRPLGGPVPDWQVTVGGGVAAIPAYEGSNEQRVSPAPTVDIRYKDLAYLSIGEGIGVNIFRGTNYRAGIGLAFDYGREHNAATGVDELSGTHCRYRCLYAGGREREGPDLRRPPSHLRRFTLHAGLFRHQPR